MYKNVTGKERGQNHLEYTKGKRFGATWNLESGIC